MGNFCMEFCNNLNNTIRGKTTKVKTGGKKAKFIDFNIGQSTINQEEFKLATKRRKEEQERRLEMIDTMKPQELEQKLNAELAAIKENMLQQRFMAHKNKVKIKQTTRAYRTTLLEKEELLQSVLGFSSLKMLNEKQCEPSGFFPLKNSDELLWEDQTEYLSSIILEELIDVQQYSEYQEMKWHAQSLTKSQKKYMIIITQLQDKGAIKLYEKNFYYNKSQQVRLSLLNQESITEEQYDITYNQKWFILNYSQMFIRIYERPIATLRDIIKIRKKLQKPYKEGEILGLLYQLMRALRDAETIYINHGNVNDENIYLSQEGHFKLGEFGELRIAKLRDQVPDGGDDIAHSVIESSSEESFQQGNRFTCTHSYLKYYMHKVEPRHQLFWNEIIHPIMMDGVKLYYNKQTELLQQLHDPEKFSWNIGPEQVEISSVLMSQNMYSLAIIAIQMMSLGKFEDDCISHQITEQTEQNEDDMTQKLQLVQSFSGIQFSGKKHAGHSATKFRQFAKYQIKTYEELLVYLQQYNEEYRVLVMYLVDMLKKTVDWKLIMEQLKEEDFDTPSQMSIYTDYTLKNPPPKPLLHQMVTTEEQQFGLLTKAFHIIDEFMELRKLYYQIQSYMLIRNFKLALAAIKYLMKNLAQLSSKNDTNKMYHYKISNLQDILFAQYELYLLQLFLAISEMETKALKHAFTNLVRLEGDLEKADLITLKYVNLLNVKFYQAMVTYTSGEAENALVLFDRIIQISKGNLKSMNEQAYYQFVHIYFLLQLDSDGYFIAFKYIEDMTDHEEHVSKKYDQITKDLIITNFNRGKAYYEVSQFVLSRHYFTISLQMIKQYNGSGSDLDSLRLINLGYLAYVNYLTNDMESMRANLGQSTSIMQETLSTGQCLDTVVIWLNFFGFMLQAHFLDLEEMYQFIEVFELTIERNKIKIDKFFTNFVFGKMYYYSGNIKKGQELMLNAVQLQQYFIADELRIKQTQNISVNQMREGLEEKIRFLQQYQEMQQKFNTTLPHPERDNLTVRILIEIYDWLGYLYIRQKDTAKATRCYDIYNEMATNLFQFEETLVDEYTLRMAKIKFYLKQYDQCLEMMVSLSLNLKQQKVDDDLIFEYQQIQCEIQRWIGSLHLLAGRDDQAKKAYKTSREEIVKLINNNEIMMKELKRLTSDSKFHSQDSVRFLSQSSMNPNQEQAVETKPSSSLLNYHIMQQAPIIILIIQNYMKIVWDCYALNQTKLSIQYIEESLAYLEQNQYLNSQLFKDVLQSSIKVDMFFLYGYIYGLRGQHEETNIYYQRAFKIVKEVHDNNQLDQNIILRMSVLYDQMARVLANQGFYIKATTYLKSSLHLLQQLKKGVSEIAIAYKHANIGAMFLRLGKTQEAQIHTESAIKLFQNEFGRISIQVLTSRVKLMEIVLISSKPTEIKRQLFQLIKTYSMLPETEQSIRFDGQVDRLTAQFKQKYGHYNEAFQLYVAAFVKLLEDNEMGLLIFSKMQKGDDEIGNLLKIKARDRASQEVILRIAEIYISNQQFYLAYSLMSDLLRLTQGQEYVAPQLNNIQLFGIDQDHEVHKFGEGIVKTLHCFCKIDKEFTSQTVYECRRNEIMNTIKGRRNVNILFEADIYRLQASILNYWQSRKQEPYLFEDYKQLLRDPYWQICTDPTKQDEIKQQQEQCLNTLLDALIIYQETIGDYHDNFIETLYHLACRQYLNDEYEEVEKYLPQLIGLLKGQNYAFPLNQYRAILMQIKIRIRQNKVARTLIEYMRRVYLDEKDDEDEHFKKTVRLLKSDNTILYDLLSSWFVDFQSKLKLTFIQIMEREKSGSEQVDEQLPGQLRLAHEAKALLTKLRKRVSKQHAKVIKDNTQIDGSKEQYEWNRLCLELEMRKLEQILDCVLYN